MRIKLAFGEEGLWVEVPNKALTKVLRMRPTPAIENPQRAVLEALEHPIGTPPLSRLAQGKKSARVAICDITRPVPNPITLPPLLQCLEDAGIPREHILIVIATGIHRPNLGEELNRLVGSEVARQYSIINHRAKEAGEHALLGSTSRGTPVYVDSRFLEGELRITCGFIEPHLMAGFSGGRKMICPGLASLETVRIMHGPKILEHPNAREGVLEGNPFHEEVLEMARMARVDFILDVALNESRQLAGIFAGHLEKAHQVGVEFVRDHAMDTVPEPVDVVVTTGGGYPLDATFYQAIKGLTAALPIVKEKGTLIIAAECREGLGSPEFSQLVRETPDLEVFMRKILQENFFVVDQWQLEELAKVTRRAEVYLVSRGISPSDRSQMPIKVVETVEDALEEAFRKHGPQAKVAVIPQGPYVLARVR